MFNKKIIIKYQVIMFPRLSPFLTPSPSPTHPPTLPFFPFSRPPSLLPHTFSAFRCPFRYPFHHPSLPPTRCFFHVAARSNYLSVSNRWLLIPSQAKSRWVCDNNALTRSTGQWNLYYPLNHPEWVNQSFAPTQAPKHTQQYISLITGGVFRG